MLRLIWFLLLGFVLSAAGESLPGADNLPHFPKRKRALLQFCEDTSLGAYRKVGSRSAKWDKDAETALLIWSRWICEDSIVSGTTNYVRMVESFRKALDAGCDDPLVRYATARIQQSRKEKLYSRSLHEVFIEAMAALDKHSYPAIREAVMYSKSARYLKRDNPRDNFPADTELARRWMTNATERLGIAIKENAPREEIYDVAETILEESWLIDTSPDVAFAFMKKSFEKNVKGKNPAMLVIEAMHLYKWGWVARGTGYTDTITEEGGRLFVERLGKAQKLLEQAYALDPKDQQISYCMLQIAGSAGSREEQDTWFERGKKADQGHYPLYKVRLNFLQPKWGGSDEEIMQLGRDCAAGKDWENRIPFVLLDAYRMVDGGARMVYRRNPQAWKDAQSLYETYLKKYPVNNVIRSAYCYNAAMAEDRKLARQLFDQMGDLVVPLVFGADYDMIRQNIFQMTQPSVTAPAPKEVTK